MQVRELSPVFVVDLFPPLQTALLDLLGDLTDDEWTRPTVCAGWSVKDVALHVLGDLVSILSYRRDGYTLPANLDSWDDLLAFINQQNEVWVGATRHMSTPVLCALLAFLSPQVHAYFESLDPFAPGGVVAWADSRPAPVWLEIAREYTEYWTHQQHIRDAVNKPGLKEPRFLTPVLQSFVYALPRTFQDVMAADPTLVKLVITGEAGGEWHLVYCENGWRLYAASDLTPTCVVTMDADTAWRLFTKGMTPEQARPRAAIEGGADLGLHLLNTVSMMA